MTYLIEQWHDSGECMLSLSDIVEDGPGFQGEACCYPYTPGEHRLYAFVEAESAQEAEESIFEPYRSRARVTPVDQLTPEQVSAFQGK